MREYFSEDIYIEISEKLYYTSAMERWVEDAMKNPGENCRKANNNFIENLEASGEARRPVGVKNLGNRSKFDAAAMTFSRN